jgi:hypothetical protein
MRRSPRRTGIQLRLKRPVIYSRLTVIMPPP